MNEEYLCESVCITLKTGIRWEECCEYLRLFFDEFCKISGWDLIREIAPPSSSIRLLSFVSMAIEIQEELTQTLKNSRSKRKIVLNHRYIQIYWGKNMPSIDSNSLNSLDDFH